MYKEKLAEVSNAKTKIVELNKELEGLASLFNEETASNKYKDCYKTP